MDLSEYLDFFNESKGPLFIFLIVIRFIVAFYCESRAKKLNRSGFGWYIFGFFFPILALIIIQFMKPRFVWDNVSEVDVPEENNINPENKTANYNSREILPSVGFILVVFGTFKVIQYFFPVIDYTFLAPIILIACGIAVLLQQFRS